MSKEEILLSDSCKIIVGSDLQNDIESYFNVASYDKILMIIDSVVLKKYPLIISSFARSVRAEVIKLSPGTKKNYQQVGKIVKSLKKHGLNRKSCILAIGGGHTGDLCGFVASIYMRGIDMVFIPTTLMSQADCILGKVAVNFKNEKNLLGNFYQPVRIFCDLNFLISLEFQQYVSGMVEIWKHGVLSNDLNIMNCVNDILLTGNIKKLDESLIAQSIKIKKAFVENDLRDQCGVHKALSLGHTTANYFEKNKNINHGEAVLYGVLFSLILSKNLVQIDDEKFSKLLYTIKLFIKHVGRKKIIISMIKKRMFPRCLLGDKINHGGKYNFVIPYKETWRVSKNVPEKIIKNAVEEFVYILDSNQYDEDYQQS